MRLIGNLRLRTKLAIGFGLLMFIITCATAIGIASTGEIRKRLTGITENDNPRLLAVTQIESQLAEVLIASEHGTEDGSALPLESKEEMLASLEEVGDARYQYVLHAGDTASTRSYVGLIDQATKYAAIMISTGNTSSHDGLEAAVSAVDKASDDLKLSEQLNFSRLSIGAFKYVNGVQLVQIILFYIGLLTSALVGIMLVRAILVPMARLGSGVEAIANGNLRFRLKVATRDEFGQLATAFNQMAQMISKSTKRLEQQRDTVESQVVKRTKELNDEKARFLASINSLPLGFILTDRRGKIIHVNAPAYELLSLTDNVVGKTTAAISKNSTVVQSLIGKIDEALHQAEGMVTADITRDDRFLRAFMSPVSTHGRSIGVVILIENITEAKILERSKDEFFSIASHELRTPLTAIRGNTSMIMQYYTDQLKDKDLHDMVSDIHGSSVRLIDIVNDFLDASRLEQGKMKFKYEQFAMEPIIEQVVYEMAAVSKEKQVYLRMANDLGTLPEVYADKDRVKQVIYNLVGNAMKFVDEGGVTIEAHVEGDHIELDVVDTGRGISHEGQQLLFHKFQQTNDKLLTRDTTRGTGLGLYISKLLTERMGGKIGLKSSEPGKGSVFFFTIPLHPVAEAPDEA